MTGRSPGITTGKSIRILDETGSNWNKIPFRNESCGCGASMRAACIGLCFRNDLKKLIAVGVEAGRITHHNAIAYLGSVLSAMFTGLIDTFLNIFKALAIKNVHPNLWPSVFFDAIPTI